jgi:hypothetical protein
MNVRLVWEDTPGHSLHSRRNFKQTGQFVRAQRCRIHCLEACCDLPAYSRSDFGVHLVHLLNGANTFGLTDAILFPIERRNPLNPPKLRTQALNITGGPAQLLPNSCQRPFERVHVPILAKTCELPRCFRGLPVPLRATCHSVVRCDRVRWHGFVTPNKTTRLPLRTWTVGLG